MPQFSNSGRVVTVVAVVQGNVYYANAGDTIWTPAINATGNTPPLAFNGVVYSACNNQLMFFADGTNYVFFTPSTSTVSPWVASAGILPADSGNNTPRLICTWRGRTVLSGLLLDSQNWFMSKVSDPTDWNYAGVTDPVTGEVSIAPNQAIAGNNSPLGLIGDVVTSLCPYTDDVLIMFGDSTIWMFNGDPMAGGQIDLISDEIGGVWGICWCKDPYGTIYFMSNRCGVYTLVPGNAPQRISQQIEQQLLAIDTGSNNIRLFWDDTFQGLHLFVSPIDAPGPTTHFFYEARSGAWWNDQFASPNFDPLTGCVFQGNTPGDRRVLLGSWDGFVRFLDQNAPDDDGLQFESEVMIGPILTQDLDDILIKDLQAIMGHVSGNVSFGVYIGATAELALASAPVTSGTWTKDRNLLTHIRRSGHAVYIGITATGQWSMEEIRVRLALEGKVRRRGS